MTKPYQLDAISRPGDILIVTEGHPCYSAQTFTIAERFAEQLDNPAPIALPERTESTLDEQREERIRRVIARIVVDGIADQAIVQSNAIAAQVRASF
jgi:hypothetical protein